MSGGAASDSYDGQDRSEGEGGGRWIHRPVRGQDARKAYRCPGCDQQIRVGEPHVVAWRDDWYGGADDRRHWHTPCWRSRHRLPRLPRG